MDCESIRKGWEHILFFKPLNTITRSAYQFVSPIVSKVLTISILGKFSIVILELILTETSLEVGSKTNSSRLVTAAALGAQVF